MAEAVRDLLACGPAAIAETKRLVRDATASLAPARPAPSGSPRLRAGAEGAGGAGGVPREAEAGDGRRTVRRVLIANRGEIAVRVARACRELGHRGGRGLTGRRARTRPTSPRPTPPSRSPATSTPTRSSPRRSTAGADAVHPGYGFLAERPEFAEAVAAAGLRWVGPPPEAMRLLGDKVEARRLAEAAGVPVVAGLRRRRPRRRRAARRGRSGWAPRCWSRRPPAAAGAGMRARRRPGRRCPRRWRPPGARRRPRSATTGVFLERRLGRGPPRRGAAAGRRARARGAPGRARLLAAAPPPEGRRGVAVARGRSRAARRAGRGRRGPRAARPATPDAGTAEFLLDADGGWCFLELNARLQVEHPVTEAVTGIDLVRAQLEIAGGEPLELEQDDVACPATRSRCGCTPRTRPPASCPRPAPSSCSTCPAGPACASTPRCARATRSGCGYDPLLAKIIAHAEDRDACIDRLAAALAETRMLGRRHQPGVPALGAGRRRRSGAGEATTAFVERRWERRPGAARCRDGAVPQAAPDDRLARLRRGRAAHRRRPCTAATRSTAAAHYQPGRGRRARRSPRPRRRARWRRRCRARCCACGSTRATQVTEGQVLVLLEAMKMELAVQAPAAGVVRAVLVAAGPSRRAPARRCSSWTDVSARDASRSSRSARATACRTRTRLPAGRGQGARWSRSWPPPGCRWSR